MRGSHLVEYRARNHRLVRGRAYTFIEQHADPLSLSCRTCECYQVYRDSTENTHQILCTGDDAATTCDELYDIVREPVWNAPAKLGPCLRKLAACRRVFGPVLPIIETGETFGLVTSQFSISFGGLIQMKPEKDEAEEDELLHLALQSDSSSSDELDPMSVIQSLNIDPILLSMPQTRTQICPSPSQTVQALSSESFSSMSARPHAPNVGLDAMPFAFSAAPFMSSTQPLKSVESTSKPIPATPSSQPSKPPVQIVRAEHSDNANLTLSAVHTPRLRHESSQNAGSGPEDKNRDTIVSLSLQYIYCIQIVQVLTYWVVVFVGFD